MTTILPEGVGKHRLEGVSQITLVGIDDSGGRSEPVIIPIDYVGESEGEDDTLDAN